MAKRRMFSMKIVDTDAFMDMPLSSQLLYFHLAMRADDDGFVASPKKIMRMVGAQEDDYSVLSVKKFIIPFDSGICVIKHWRIHNYIQTDRYEPTQYIREKEQLIIDEKTNKYSLNKECIQNVSKMLPQVRLGKVRIGKSKTTLATETVAEGFDSDSYLQEMSSSKTRHIAIIGDYLKDRGYSFPTKLAAQTEIKRWVKDARVLADYPTEQIDSACDYVRGKWPDEWNLSTVAKYINK